MTSRNSVTTCWRCITADHDPPEFDEDSAALRQGKYLQKSKSRLIDIAQALFCSRERRARRVEIPIISDYAFWAMAGAFLVLAGTGYENARRLRKKK
jgi:hypothetical protein